MNPLRRTSDCHLEGTIAADFTLDFRNQGFKGRIARLARTAYHVSEVCWLGETSVDDLHARLQSVMPSPRSRGRAGGVRRFRRTQCSSRCRGDRAGRAIDARRSRQQARSNSVRTAGHARRRGIGRAGAVRFLADIGHVARRRHAEEQGPRLFVARRSSRRHLRGKLLERDRLAVGDHAVEIEDDEPGTPERPGRRRLFTRHKATRWF